MGFFLAPLLLACCHFVGRTRGEVCTGSPADVIFAMDESSSIWPPHFRKQREFLANLTDGFDIAPGRTRIGVVTFADDYTLRFHLDAFDSNKDVKAAVGRIDQKTGGTRTDLALKYVREKMLEKGRESVPKLVILVTDGVSSQRDQTMEQSTLLKAENVSIIVVAISSQINWDEINGIASEPIAKHVFGIKSFNDLSYQLVRQLVQTACDVQGNPPLAPRVPKRTTTAATTTLRVTSPRASRRTPAPTTRRTTAATALPTTPRRKTTAAPPVTATASIEWENPPVPLAPSIWVYSERETKIDVERQRHEWHNTHGMEYATVDVHVPLGGGGARHQGLEGRGGVIKIGPHSLDGATNSAYDVRSDSGLRSIQVYADRMNQPHSTFRISSDGNAGGSVKVAPQVGDGALSDPSSDVYRDPVAGVVIRVLANGDNGREESCNSNSQKVDLAVVFGGRNRENAVSTLAAVESLARDPDINFGADGARLALLPGFPRPQAHCSCWNGNGYDACDASAGSVREFGFNDYGNDKEALVDHLSGRKERRREDPSLAELLNKLRTRVFKARAGARKEAKKVAVVFMDSPPKNIASTLEAARLAKSAGVKLVFVGLGRSVSYSDLAALASEPTSENVYVIDGHPRVEDIKRHLQLAIC